MHHSRSLAKVLAGLTAPPPEYVDDRALAARTPFARVTWQTWRRTGEGPPFYRHGRRCIYRWSEVVAFLETTKVGGK